MTETYLGDGLYAEWDGYQVKLYASNGVIATNTVYLEPDVLESFLEFVKNIKKARTSD